MRRFLLLILFCTTVLSRGASAEALLSAADDSLVVHNLAHYGAGTLVAVVPDFILTRFDKKSWVCAWYTRLAVDCLVAAAVTDVYEAQTDKDPTTRLRHDLAGALGAATLVGASVHWTFR